MIRASVKRLVRSIYVMRCGYCQVSEAEAGAELTFDHFQPPSQGGRSGSGEKSIHRVEVWYYDRGVWP
jgi:hypothetical protein